VRSNYSFKPRPLRGSARAVTCTTPPSRCVARLNSGVRALNLISIPQELLSYYSSGRPLVCELDATPFGCEFWPVEELEAYNSDYQVQELAPGYFGFATSGGGEMYAFSPSGAIVCLPFIGMEPAEANLISPTWHDFVNLLRSAL